nr:unnamed protein product [Digitaria exilis]
MPIATITRLLCYVLPPCRNVPQRSVYTSDAARAPRDCVSERSTCSGRASGAMAGHVPRLERGTRCHVPGVCPGPWWRLGPRGGRPWQRPGERRTRETTATPTRVGNLMALSHGAIYSAENNPRRGSVGTKAALDDDAAHNTQSRSHALAGRCCVISDSPRRTASYGGDPPDPTPVKNTKSGKNFGSRFFTFCRASYHFTAAALRAIFRFVLPPLPAKAKPRSMQRRQTAALPEHEFRYASQQQQCFISIFKHAIIGSSVPGYTPRCAAHLLVPVGRKAGGRGETPTNAAGNQGGGLGSIRFDRWIELKGTCALGCDGPFRAGARGTGGGPFDPGRGGALGLAMVSTASPKPTGQAANPSP